MVIFKHFCRYEDKPAPTYRLDPDVHKLLGVLAGQLAHAEDGLSLLMTGVGRIGEVLGALHQGLQLTGKDLRCRRVQVFSQALNTTLQNGEGDQGF